MRLSPIAITAVAAAAAAVAVVVALQNDAPGRVTVRDALATPIPGTDDARLTMTIVNDGGDDRILGLVIPMAGAVQLVHGSGGADGRPEPSEPDAATVALAMPAGASIALEAGGDYILASDVDWSAVTDARIPLSIRLERSDAITVFIDVDRME